MPEHKHSLNFLFNPFKSLSQKLTLLIGVAVILLSGVLNSLSDTHFDGILDIHTGLPTASWFHLAEGFINIMIITLLLFVLDKLILKSPGKLGNLFSQQALARWPYLIVSIGMLKLAEPFHRYEQYFRYQNGITSSSMELSIGNEIIFYFSVALMLLITVWYIYLSYRSFSIYVKASGWKIITLYSAGLIVAEVLSKIVFISLIK
ncbi:MAG: hypothetical protein HQ562_02350 [Candidatus Marinimicrobia bacterium]|nr:hypothetical protein [Candidatus Neomarinimicrobiota bacterium]